MNRSYPENPTQSQSLFDCFWIAFAVRKTWTYFRCNALVFPVHNFCFRFPGNFLCYCSAWKLRNVPQCIRQFMEAFVPLLIFTGPCRWDKKFPFSLFLPACPRSFEVIKWDLLRALFVHCVWFLGGKDNKYSGRRWDPAKSLFTVPENRWCADWAPGFLWHTSRPSSH